MIVEVRVVPYTSDNESFHVQYKLWRWGFWYDVTRAELWDSISLSSAEYPKIFLSFNEAVEFAKTFDSKEKLMAYFESERRKYDAHIAKLQAKAAARYKTWESKL